MLRPADFIAPLFVVWFGFGMAPKVISAFLLGFFLGAIFPVLIATYMGLFASNLRGKLAAIGQGNIKRLLAYSSIAHMGYALVAFGAVVVPPIFIVLLFAVPWLDRSPQHYSAISRPFATIIGILVVVIVVLNMLMAVSRIMNFPTV